MLSTPALRIMPGHKHHPSPGFLGRVSGIARGRPCQLDGWYGTGLPQSPRLRICNRPRLVSTLSAELDFGRSRCVAGQVDQSVELGYGNFR
jgi:hypothetical protein